jgi:long-chain acyl-CoA synthetase
MKRETLIDFFNDFAKIPKTFLVFDDGFRSHHYSYAQVAGAARSFAARLREAGIGPGERVLFWSENRPEWIAAFWGCVLAGVVVVPIDYRASIEMRDRIAGVANVRAVLTGDEVSSRPEDWKLRELDWSAGTFSPVNAQPGDLCQIIFTSGATAEPQGVTITHANILANVIPVEQEILKYRKWSVPFAPIRFLNLLPLSHLFGQSMATFIPPVLPGEVIFMTGFNPGEIARQVKARRISVLVCVPKILDVLREFISGVRPEAEASAPAGNWMRRWWHYRRIHDLFGWKFWCFIAGAAPLSVDLEEFWSKLGFLVVQGYGLTETAPIVTLNHPFHASKGSVGKPIAGVDVKIAADGEILVRGANVTSGYFGAAGTDAAFIDGWFHTGDIGAMNPDGTLAIRGRKKEMIVTPEGLNVFPEDVERVLNAAPGVKESAVVGLENEGREQVHAVAVLEPGANTGEIVSAANRQLESHQQIRGLLAWPEPALPRTEGTGKLKRVAIAQWLRGAGALPSSNATADADLLAGYSDDTPLAQIGLSSLDRVELMVRAEKGTAAQISEASFTQAQTVGELRRLSRGARAAPAETIRFPRWNRSVLARALRRAALPVVLLPLLRIFVRLRVSGREHLRDLEGPLLFAANHQSVFDVPTILAALPPRFRYRLATAAGMHWFRAHFHPEGRTWFDRFGNALQYYLVTLFFGVFPLPQHEAGAREALRYAGDLASDGWSVLLFPEGVRTSQGEIAPFRPGVGMMASRLGLKIVPVRIEGLDRVLHTSWHFPRPGRVRVTFGPVLTIEGDSYAAIAQAAENAVRALS